MEVYPGFCLCRLPEPARYIFVRLIRGDYRVRSWSRPASQLWDGRVPAESQDADIRFSSGTSWTVVTYVGNLMIK